MRIYCKIPAFSVFRYRKLRFVAIAVNRNGRKRIFDIDGTIGIILFKNIANMFRLISEFRVITDMAITASAAFAEHVAGTFNSVRRSFDKRNDFCERVTFQNFQNKDFHNVSDSRGSNKNDEVFNGFIGKSSDTEAFARHCDNIQRYSVIFVQHRKNTRPFFIYTDYNTFFLICQVTNRLCRLEKACSELCKIQIYVQKHLIFSTIYCII